MLAKPGNLNAATHLARSERRIRPLARHHRRRLLRQLGLSVRDLDAIRRAYLDLYCRAATKVRLYDQWIDEHGALVDAEGNAPGFMGPPTSPWSTRRS
jgi:hypothetical protein